MTDKNYVNAEQEWPSSSAFLVRIKGAVVGVSIETMTVSTLSCAMIHGDRLRRLHSMCGASETGGNSRIELVRPWRIGYQFIRMSGGACP